MIQRSPQGHGVTAFSLFRVSVAAILQRPGEHHAKDGDDDTQVQKQIAPGDYIVQPKDKWQDVVDDHKQDADQWQQTFAMCEVV